MTTAFVSLPPNTKVWEAIDRAREEGRDNAETLYYIYVCDDEDRLLGVVSLRDLILSEAGQPLDEVMIENVVTVDPDEDQEHVAREMAKYDFAALPVVSRGRIVGLVTVDDVVDVVIEEATADAQMMGGMVPLEDSYFQTGWAEFIWKRGSWLVLLFFGQLITTTVMERNHDLLDTMVDLVVFIPLVIASGGNAGSQSSALIIRALAVDEVKPSDWFRILLRELVIGLCLGAALALMGFCRIWFGGGHKLDPFEFARVIATSIISIVTLSAIVGSLLPLGIRRLGIDPAVSSTPFIMSLVDVLGLTLYFSVANWLL